MGPKVDPAVERLYLQLSNFPIVDTHTHLDPHRATARGLDDILGYHYYTELAHSTGTDKALLQRTVGPWERVRAVAASVASIRNTIQFGWFEFIVREFFDYRGEISAATLEDIWAAAEKTLSRPTWESELVHRVKLWRAVLTNDFDQSLDGIDTTRYVPCLRTDELVFKLEQPEVRRRLQNAADVTVVTPGDLKEAFARLVEHFRLKGACGLAISLPPDFQPCRVTEAEATGPLHRLLTGAQQLSGEDRVRLSQYALWSLVELSADYGLPFSLMIGVRRKVYRDGVPQGRDLLDLRWSLYQYADLLNTFSGVVFPVSVLSAAHAQELVAFSWIFPNVVAHGHWWYANIPALFDADLRARLTAIPVSKQIGYYSDAYCLEFVLPKFDMYRRRLASVLWEEFMVGRGWREEEALELAWAVLVENPCRILGLQAPARPW
jgi:glucuronate isomerase